MFVNGVRKTLYGVSNLISMVCYLVRFKKRSYVCNNLRIISGDSKKAKNVFFAFGKNHVDFFLSPLFNKVWVGRNVEFVGLDDVNEVLKKPSGAIFAAAHIGNWEMGCMIMALLGYPVHTVFWKHKNFLVNRYFKGRRTQKGIKGIPLDRHAGAACMRTLVNHNILAVAVDRNYGEEGEPVSFFGTSVSLPRGAAVLALKTSVPIIPTFCIRKRDDSFLFKCCTPRYYDKNQIHTENQVSYVMNDYTKIIEENVLEYHDQWSMFHDVFGKTVNSKS